MSTSTGYEEPTAWAASSTSIGSPPEQPIAGHRVGAEPFCKGVVGFVTTLRHLEMRQLVSTPGEAAALYDAELPGGTCRFAEFFELDTRVITDLRLVFDPKRYIELGGH